MADIIKKHGWDKKVIGVEMDQFYFTHRAFVELEKSLPNATFKDANTLVNWVRVIKSDNEIEFMKIAGQIASNVMKTAQKHIAPGVRECDVAAEVAKAQYKGVGEYSGDYPAIVPLMMAGEATKTPHLTWSEKKYENDEAVLLELCGVYRHYHVPIARTLYLGEEPPKLMVDTGKTVLEGLDAALDMIKPGVLVEDIEATWRKTIEKTGLVKESRIGYSIGVNYPPDWGEQTISVRPGDKTVVQENMALHLIPGIWLDDVGFEVDASFYVTKDGVKQFFDDSREILVKK
jgi:Xaa-Pro dipeptidase